MEQGVTAVATSPAPSRAYCIPSAHPSPEKFPFEHRRREAQHACMRNLWNKCLELLAAWRAARARDELRDLSDRTLKDIGLTRSQIGSLFR